MLLLIDDDESFRSGLADNLREDGYDLAEYESGLAVPLDRVRDVDAVLTDYLMDREDGLAFAKRFHDAFPMVPIIIITAYATAHLEKEVAAQAYLTLLQKPVDYARLLELLEQKLQP